MIALLTWGNQHFTPDGLSVVLTDLDTGATIEPILIDGVSGKPIVDANYVMAAGPAANEGVHNRMAYAAKKRALAKHEEKQETA